MNTEIYKKVINLLEESTEFQPKEKILENLSLVIDRVKFSPEIEELFCSKQSVSKKEEAINFFFEHEISSHIYNFLISLAKEDLLKILTGDETDKFLNVCKNHFSRIKEIEFITAVKLSKIYRQQLVKKIKLVNDDQVRFVFKENPYLIGGFVVQTDNGIYDYSLKTNVIYYLRIYLKDKLNKLLKK